MKYQQFGLLIVALAALSVGCKGTRNPVYCDALEPECREGYVCDIKLHTCARVVEVPIPPGNTGVQGGSSRLPGGPTDAAVVVGGGGGLGGEGGMAGNVGRGGMTGTGGAVFVGVDANGRDVEGIRGETGSSGLDGIIRDMGIGSRDGPSPIATVDAGLVPATCPNPVVCPWGNRRCGVNGGVETCAAGATGCPVWGTEATCPGVQTCKSAGADAMCVCPNAPSECVGKTSGMACDASKANVIRCAMDTQGCVSSTTTACPTGKPCEGDYPTAKCSSCPAVPSDCNGEIGKSCKGNELITCGQDLSGCVTVVSTITCPVAQPCMGTAPGGTCTCPAAMMTVGGGCTTRGASACLGGSPAICSGTDGLCLSWVAMGGAIVATAGVITGSPTVCLGQGGVPYAVGALTNASGYVWEYAGGMGFSIASGTNTNAIVANISAGATSGTLTVYGANACGKGAASAAYAISVNTISAVPVAGAATYVTQAGFTANWTVSVGAASYSLDVATDSGFANLVAGFSNRDVGNFGAYAVSGLAPSTTYHYRVRANGVCGASGNSSVMSVATGAAIPKAWGKAELIETDDAGTDYGPDVVMDKAGNATVVWYQNLGGMRSDRILSNRYVIGSGWQKSVDILSFSATGDRPRVSTNANGNAIAVWEADYLIVSRRNPAGNGWGGQADQIQRPPGGVLPARGGVPDVGIDAAGNAIAVWQQADPGYFNCWANRYEVGATWGAPSILHEANAGPIAAPRIVVGENGNAIAVWQQGEGAGSRSNIWANRYVAGAGWAGPSLVETDNAGAAEKPQVALDGNGNAVAVWQQSDGTRSNVWANRYLAGAGWAGATLIETDNSGGVNAPQVAVSFNGNAMAVWEQSDGTRTSIWANRFVPGSGWGGAALIEAGTGAANSAQVAVDRDGNAIVVWQQTDGIRYNVWTNRYIDGTGWVGGMLLETNDAGAAFQARVAIDGNGNATVVWSQEASIGKASIWANRFQ